MNIATQLKSLIPTPAKTSLRYLLKTAKKFEDDQIEQELSQKFFISKEEIFEFKREIQESKLIYELMEKNEAAKKIVKNTTDRENPYQIGSMSPVYGVYLYSILRKLQPEVAVETGVCNGFSTAFSLMALHNNQKGKLYSIDLPQQAGIDLDEKNYGVIPKQFTPGWVIPDYLRERWELILGKSQEKLPELLDKLQQIDFFMHDSEHSYECMWFEFNAAYKVLRAGGILMSDDITWNESFTQFAKEHEKSIIHIGTRMGFFIK